jgi:hypothetical protein
MKALTDLDINREIRKVLVKHWIDLGRLSIRTSRGRVMIHGLLDRIAGSREKLSSPIVEAMFEEIHRIDGVNRVTAELANWVNSEGKSWVEIERGKHMIQTDQQSAGHRQTSYDITSS